MKEIIKKIPFVVPVYRKVRDFYLFKIKTDSPQEIFTEIYKGNKFGNDESFSGPGSTLEVTRHIVDELPKLLHKHSIESLLDIPCGDFNWMKTVKFGSIKYTGADIVEDLIERNKEKYETENISFLQLNLIEDKLPKVDAVFCRDCLSHLSNEHILEALKNIKNSGTKYLITTTYPECAENKNILTGQWRKINLEHAPFALPKPVDVFYEKYAEGNGENDDKALGVWRVDDIKIVNE